MNTESDFLYWEDLKTKLRNKYPRLTNADLHWRHSTSDDLLRTIANKLGKSNREMLEEIEKF